MSITLGRPLAASLLLAGIVILAVAGVVVGWAGLASAVDERDAQGELLTRSVAANRRLASSPAAEQTDPFVEADTQTLAAARIDALIRSVADDNSGAVLSSRSEAKPDEDGIGIGGHIEAQAVIEGQNEALQSILVKLEGSDPVILVDALTLEPADLASDAAPGDPQAPRLRMTLTLGAYWKAAPH